MLLGYADRSAVLDPAHADRVAPGANGLFRPVVVAGGRVVGTWRATPNGPGPVAVEEFVPFTAAWHRGVTRAAERLAALPV
jgi:hypothetical protein